MATGRMLRSKISCSPQVNDLSLKAALLFTWIIPHLDDFGRMLADPRRIKATVVPMRDDITSKDIHAALQEMEAQNLLVLYDVNDEIHLSVTKFDENQGGLHKRTSSKLPAPPPLEAAKNKASGKFREIPGNSGKFPANRIELNRIELNRIELNKTSCAEAEKTPASAPAKEADKVFIFIPLVGDNEFAVTEEMIFEFENCYPAIDVRQEIKNIRAWNYSNPKNRKTKSGILRHIGNWLAKAQNQSKSYKQNFEIRKLNNVDHNQLVLNKILREEEEKNRNPNLIERGVVYDNH